jgi:hypothetical protein
MKIEEMVIYFQLIGYVSFQVEHEQRFGFELQQQELGQLER